MSSTVHPLARASLANVSLMDPIVRYQPDVTERIFTNALAPDFGRYPCPVRADLAERYAAHVRAQLRRPESSPPIAASQVVFTPGSTVSIDLLVRAFCEPGLDRICTVTPAFPVYAHYASAYGVGIRAVPAPSFDDVDAEALTAKSAKLTFLCRPTWPLGTLFDLDRIDEIAARAGGLVVVDEAYIDFADGESAVTLLDRRPNVVVMRTLSKSWGLAGLRVGVVIGAPAALHPVRVLLDPFSFHVAAQQAVESRLDHPEWIRLAVSLIAKERDRMARVAGGLPNVRQVFPSHANFFCVALHDPRAFLAAAQRERLLVRDLSPLVEHGLRISVVDAVHNERVLELLAAGADGSFAHVGEEAVSVAHSG